MRSNKDVVLKVTAGALRGDLLERFGLHLPPIVDVLPSEVPRVTVRLQETDLLFRLADGTIAHFEFQMKQGPDDLFRFFAYHAAIFDHYRVPVWTVVFYGPGVRRPRSILRIGSVTFRVRNVLVGQQDGDAALRRLHEKVQRGETFDAGDRVDLMFAPLMRQQRPTEVILREAVGLAQRLPVEQRELAVGALLGLTYHDVDKSVVFGILKEFEMRSVLEQYIDARMEEAEEIAQARGLERGMTQGLEKGLEQGLTQGLEQGLTQGELEGKRAALRMVITARFGNVPSAVEQRLVAADSTILDALLARVATADSLDAL